MRRIIELEKLSFDRIVSILGLENPTKPQETRIFKIMYFIHNLAKNQYLKKDEWFENKWLNMNSKLLIEIYGPRYKNEVITPLVDNEIIEVRTSTNGTKSYSTGNFSIGYRLKKEYLESEYKIITIKSSLFNKRLNTINDDREYVSRNNLNFFFKYEDNFYDYLLDNVNKFKINKDFEYEQQYHFLIDRAKTYKFLYIDESVRHYHKFTTLPSEYRKYITYKDEELVELDIRNSQPLLLTSVFKEYIDNNETRKYKELVESGNFYEFLMKDIKNPNREQIKRDVFRYIFFATKKMRSLGISNGVVESFKNEFPMIFRFIQNIESLVDFEDIPEKVKSKENDRLSFLLRKTESTIWTNEIIYNRLYKEHKDIPFFLLHDAIFVPKQYKELVKGIIKESYNKFGLEPTIK